MGLWNFMTFGHANKKKAENIVAYAEYKQEQIKEMLEKQRVATQEKTKLLAQRKVEAYDNSLNAFFQKCNKIGKAEWKNVDKNIFDGSDSNLLTMNESIAKQVDQFERMGLSFTGSLTAAGIAAGGTFMAVSTFGVASTGTAIGTLSGAAATNATLAWLGGGSIAAGGAGVAGGMAVLGGIAVAPVALLGMFMGAKKGNKALAEAEAYESKVLALVEKFESVIKELELIEKASDSFAKTIASLNVICMTLNKRLDPIIERIENRSFSQRVRDRFNRMFRNKSYLTPEETKQLCDAANGVKLLKALIDKPVMNENGGYLNDCMDLLKSNQVEVKKLLQNSGVGVASSGS